MKKNNGLKLKYSVAIKETFWKRGQHAVVHTQSSHETALSAPNEVSFICTTKNGVGSHDLESYKSSSYMGKVNPEVAL